MSKQQIDFCDGPNCKNSTRDFYGTVSGWMNFQGVKQFHKPTEESAKSRKIADGICKEIKGGQLHFCSENCLLEYVKTK